MVLLLSETDVRELLTMEMALGAVEAAFRELGEDQGVNIPRVRIRTAGGGLNVMSAAMPGDGVLGVRAYTASRGNPTARSNRAGSRHVCLLFDESSGQLVAIFEASTLSQIRTGAASGVATRALARADASIVGIIGTGRQAGSQLEAICAVRPIRRVRAYSRDQARRRAFAQEMEARLKVEVQPVEDSRAAVQGADVVVTITSSRSPVLEGRWLEPGVHVNAAGQNHPDTRELDTEAVARADVIAADAVDVARMESGDLRAAVAAGALTWERVVDLGAVVAGRALGRTSADQITLFESQGLGIEDVAAAAQVYQAARSHGRGLELPLFGA